VKRLKRRKELRLRHYDYASAGGYFVTICAHNRECIFGEVVKGEMKLNQCGRIVQDAWNDLTNHYPNAELDYCVIMPNHFHGIIRLRNGISDSTVGAGFPRPMTGEETQDRRGEVTSPLRGRVTLGQIVAYFKYQSTKRINDIRKTPGIPVWQCGYYEHVIRNEKDLFETRQYVQNNPKQWEMDEEYAG
jgi:REP element-mobilizing transposase RayT